MRVLFGSVEKQLILIPLKLSPVFILMYKYNHRILCDKYALFSLH